MGLQETLRDYVKALNLRMKVLPGGLDSPQPDVNPNRMRGLLGQKASRIFDSLNQA